MRLRPTHKLFAILFFYVFLAVMVVVFSSTAGVFTYPVIIGASIIFILTFRMKVPMNGFMVGLIAAIVSMGLVLAILIAIGAIRVESLKDNFAIFLIIGLLLEILVGFGEELSFRAVVFQGLNDELGLLPAACPVFRRVRRHAHPVDDGAGHPVAVMCYRAGHDLFSRDSTGFIVCIWRPL